MAEKEAAVYIVDVGKSMAVANHGRTQSDFDWALSYIWDKIATTISSGRKTLNTGVLAFRSNETRNELSEGDDSYNNICELKPLSQLLMSDLRDLQRSLQPSQTNEGDAISALVLAIHMIGRFCKKLKYIRRVIMITNGSGAMDLSHLSSIAQKLKEDNIQLTILGVDFDDSIYGYKEENKSSLKAKNEATFKSLVESCEGTLGTLQEAISELQIPRVKQVKPIPSYKGALTLGNSEESSTALSIDVERYPRVMIAKAPGASNVVFRSELNGNEKDGDTEIMGGAEVNEGVDPDMAMVRNDRTYQVKDDNAPGGKLQVERDDLARGFEYGRTAVPISESEENITKLETKAGLEIMGFVPMESFQHYMSMDRSNIVIPLRTNEKAKMALSSFIHSLYEQQSGAVARLVLKENKSPTIVFLAPSIEPDLECLIELELPFAEDIREYKFPPLDRIVTISGKAVTEHRFLPSKQLQMAMDEYVDQMDLSKFDYDEDGNPAEYAVIDDAYSPMLHRINQAVRFKAVHPDSEVPPPAETTTRFSRPPSSLVEQSSTILASLKASADVRKVPKKPLTRRGRIGHSDNSHEPEQPLSGLDVSALMSKRAASKSNRISPENAVPEFKQLLDCAESIEAVKDAVSQLSSIIREWITNSFGDSAYDRALEAMGTMRRECIDLEEPGLWNEFLRDLKKKLFNAELGGDRREFWWRVGGNRLGLIDKTVSHISKVTPEEVRSFLISR